MALLYPARFDPSLHGTSQSSSSVSSFEAKLHDKTHCFWYLLSHNRRQIANPSQMKLFLQAVLPRDQPGARERGEQQAVEGFADVPLEVKQEEGEEEEEEEAAAEEEQEGDAEAGEEEDGVDAEADNQPGLECELPFEPQPCTSITTGLQMPCGAEGRALGVLPNGLRWHVWISWMKGKACLSLGSKHTAAVAADVVYMWRQTCGNTLQKVCPGSCASCLCTWVHRN